MQHLPETAQPAPGRLDETAEPGAQNLRQRITRRSWDYIREATANAAGAVRRAPGEAGGHSLELFAKLAATDPRRALGLVRRARRLAPGGAFLAETEAILTARCHGWEAAEALLGRPARRPKMTGTAAALLRATAAPALDLALPVQDRPTHLPEAEASGIVIYTAAFGTDPLPAPMFYQIPGLRLLCLTDRPERCVPGWQSIAATPPVADQDHWRSWCAILPHRALAEAAPEARASLYLAPDRWLVGNLHTLLARWYRSCDLALWRHEDGHGWQDLAEHRLARDGAGQVTAQARDLAARGVPPGEGAWDTGLIWRRHSTEVADLMEAWWRAHQRRPGLEAISLCDALSTPAAIRPQTLPGALGAARDNIFAAALPRPPAAPRRGRRTASNGRWPVAFVYAEEYAASASTFLRGRQLSDIIAAREPDLSDMAYTSNTEDLRDRIVVLTKGALEVHSAQAIADLAKRNIAVIGSWDDMLPDADKVAATDASMALSHRQTVDFARLFPCTPVYHVTHHVNAQVPQVTPPKDRLRAGYFGLLRNTHCPPSLGRMVDLIGIATAKVEMNWLDALPHYNCHWIVRRRAKAHDGWKPFLKGFVAARCGAVVAVGRDDDDALQYLGDDYPFYVRSPDPVALEYDMAEIAAAFGGPEWRRALEIMEQVAERSSDALVCAEFRAMVADLTR